MTRQHTLSAAVPARGGASLAAHLRGNIPHQRAATPVEEDQRPGDPTPVRRATAGDRQPLRRLGGVAPQPSTTPIAQPPPAGGGPVRRLRIDAARPQPAPAHNVLIPAAQTHHVEMLEIGSDGGVHHVEGPDGKSGAASPAAPDGTPTGLPHPDGAAPINHLDPPLSSAAQPDPTSAPQAIQPPAIQPPAIQPPASHGSLFATLTGKIGKLTCFHPCCGPKNTHIHPDSAPVESITAEDRAALRTYTFRDYKKVNGYLRDPVGFTQALQHELTSEIRQKKIIALVEANQARPAEERGGLTGWAFISANEENIAAELRARAEEIRTRTRRTTAEIQTRVDRLSEALHKLPPKPGMTYRSIDYSEEILAHYEPGCIVTEAAFTGRSRNRKRALQTRAYGNVLIRILGDNGRDISTFSRYPKEKEVLYDKGTRFEVISKTRRKKPNTWLISMREIPASQTVHPGRSPVG